MTLDHLLAEFDLFAADNGAVDNLDEETFDQLQDFISRAYKAGEAAERERWINQ